MVDFVLASIDLLPESGINRFAYDEAVSQMGDVATALCILIIDRNRHHPVTPHSQPRRRSWRPGACPATHPASACSVACWGEPSIRP
ncbi:MAG: hypothetical protein AAF982_08445 [Pseudomonadota bacterium]